MGKQWSERYDIQPNRSHHSVSHGWCTNARPSIFPLIPYTKQEAQRRPHSTVIRRRRARLQEHKLAVFFSLSCYRTWGNLFKKNLQKDRTTVNRQDYQSCLLKLPGFWCKNRVYNKQCHYNDGNGTKAHFFTENRPSLVKHDLHHERLFVDGNCLRRSIARPRVYIAVSLNGDNTRCSNIFFFMS